MKESLSYRDFFDLTPGERKELIYAGTYDIVVLNPKEKGFTPYVTNISHVNTILGGNKKDYWLDTLEGEGLTYLLLESYSGVIRTEEDIKRYMWED